MCALTNCKCMFDECTSVCGVIPGSVVFGHGHADSLLFSLMLTYVTDVFKDVH